MPKLNGDDHNDDSSYEHQLTPHQYPNTGEVSSLNALIERDNQIINLFFSMNDKLRNKFNTSEMY